jgi:hypothetical protein
MTQSPRLRNEASRRQWIERHDSIRALDPEEAARLMAVPALREGQSDHIGDALRF